MKNHVLTVGHSTLELSRFLRLLQAYGVDKLVDVRSHPYSRRSPQFDRAALEEALHTIGVSYVFAGNELGGRPRNQSFYVGGQVQYDQVAASEGFRRAIRRIKGAAETSRLALMCAEGDPIECHRFLLVSRWLTAKSVDVDHILPNGQTEQHAALETRLLYTVGLLQSDMFSANPDPDALERAYRIQADRVAFIQSRSNHDTTSFPPVETA